MCEKREREKQRKVELKRTGYKDQDRHDSITVQVQVRCVCRGSVGRRTKRAEQGGATNLRPSSRDSAPVLSLIDKTRKQGSFFPSFLPPSPRSLGSFFTPPCCDALTPLFVSSPSFILHSFTFRSSIPPLPSFLAPSLFYSLPLIQSPPQCLPFCASVS